LDRLNFGSLQLSESLYKLSEDLLKSSLVLEMEDAPSLKATKRAAIYTPPASKGEIKDCLIYEHALFVMAELRGNLFNLQIVFLTSNTNDYCNSGSKPKEPIENELSQLSVVLATNWDWAFHELKLTAASP